MHRRRQAVPSIIPIPRKGTAYIARSSSHINSSVPVLLALRDMLHLADTAKEVKHIMNSGAIKINGNPVKDPHSSIRFFNILEADKSYRLTVLKTGKFSLEELKGKQNSRIVKVVGKTMLPKGKIQYHFHDGTNSLLSGKEQKVGDSLNLGFDGKVVSHIALEKSASCFIFAGSYSGHSGKIVSVKENSALIAIKELDKEVTLPLASVIVI